jgi:drug/metabolite transporter (DMT)-like permease
MGVTFALLAACAFALGAVLQQRGTLDTTSGADDSSWLIQILRKPVWLAGMALGALGWLLQALALDRAPLILVQSVTALSLVIALPFGVWLTAQRVDRMVVLGATAVVGGIVLFISAGAPSGGTTHPDSGAWWTAGLCCIALVIGSLMLAKGSKRARRALWFGTAAGFCFGFQSAVTKQLAATFGNGVTALLGSWTLYAVAVAGLAGFVLLQSGLRTGALAPAIASSNALTLFGGILLGLTVFGETLTGNTANLAVAVAGLATALLGVGLLGSRSATTRTTTRAHLTHS